MLYHVPLSIFVGRVQGHETVQLLLIQIAWIPALVILGRIMMRQARRRVLVQGG